MNKTRLLPFYNGVTAVEVPEVEFEVIDDGSSDDTVEILEKSPQLYSELVRRDRNGGKGAVRDGLYKATGDYILFQDADLEYDPSEYRTLVRPVLSGTPMRSSEAEISLQPMSGCTISGIWSATVALP